jgi:drug/metabolite transporter (DMT)-like permease
MNWILFTILAIISRSVFSLATKILSSHLQVSSITQAFMLTTLAGLLSIPFSLLTGGISFSNISSVGLLVVLMVLSQAFGNVLFFQGMKTLDAGTSQIAFSSVLIWGSLFSFLFLGSHFSQLQLLGIFIMLVAILLVQFKKDGLTLNRGILLIILAASLFGIFQVTSARISTVVNTGAYLILAYLGSSLVVGLFYIQTLRTDYLTLMRNIKSSLTLAMFASGTSLLYFIFSYFAYRVAPDRGVVVVLLTSQVILSVIFGIIFLKERQNLSRKLIAGGLAFIASVFIKS